MSVTFSSATWSPSADTPRTELCNPRGVTNSHKSWSLFQHVATTSVFAKDVWRLHQQHQTLQAKQSMPKAEIRGQARTHSKVNPCKQTAVKNGFQDVLSWFAPEPWSATRCQHVPTCPNMSQWEGSAGWGWTARVRKHKPKVLQMCSGIEPELQDPPKSESMPLGQYPISWSTKCEVPSSPAPGEFRNPQTSQCTALHQSCSVPGFSAGAASTTTSCPAWRRASTQASLFVRCPMHISQKKHAKRVSNDQIPVAWAGSLGVVALFSPRARAVSSWFNLGDATSICWCSLKPTPTAGEMGSKNMRVQAMIFVDHITG